MFFDNFNDKINWSFWTLFFGYAARGFFWGSWAALLPVIKFQINNLSINFGIDLSFITIGALASMILYGFVVDKLGKGSLLIGLFAFSISIVSINFVNIPFLTALIMFFIGITSGSLDVVLNAGVASFESITNKSCFNKAQAAFPISAVIAGPLIGALQYYGVNLHIILTMLAIIVMIVGLLSCRTCSHMWRQKTGYNKKTLFISKFLFIMGIFGASIYFIESSVQQWGAIYLKDDLYSSSFIASLGHPVFMIMLFIGRMMAHSFRRYLTDTIILIVTGISAIIGMLLISMATSQSMALAGFAVVGFGMAASIPTVMSKVGRSVPAKFRGVAIGIVTAIAYFGYLVSPLFIGGLTTLVNMRFAWLAMACFAAIFMLSLVFKYNLNATLTECN